MAAPRFLVHSDLDALTGAAADRIAALMAQVRQSSGRAPRISLTGGGAGLATAAALAARDIDWDGVEIHLGDERFVDRTDPERTGTQLASRLLDHICGHRFLDWPAPGDAGAADVDAAAASFAAAHPVPTGTEPYFDIVALGMGGEGHFNSVFPHTPQVAADAPDIMAVHDCPKLPPERMTYTLGVVRRSPHVLFLVAGAEKAAAIGAVAGGARPEDWPAAGATGVVSTEFFLDTAAASELDR